MKLAAALLFFATVQVALSAPWVKLNPSQADEIIGSKPDPWGHLQSGPSIHDAAPFGYAALARGTTGGSGAKPVTVKTLSELTSAVAGKQNKIVLISGSITGSAVVQVGSNKTVIGMKDSSLVGVGLRVLKQSNVIIRNVKISKVLHTAGDALGIQESSQVWVDHVDLSSDRDHSKDYYDGLLDITHGCTGITVSNSKLHDHWKTSLVGHSDKNGDEDKKTTVTMALNHWINLNSRTPSFRFGHGHIYNNLFENVNDGINTRNGAQLLIENNIWIGDNKKTVYATKGGYAVLHGNDFGSHNGKGPESVPTGTFAQAPYPCNLLPVSAAKSKILAEAGSTLTFSSYS